VGFLPAYAGFGAENAGLVAAGRAAAGPDMLVTDSPVVAYYSGRPPSQIAGSRSLPSDRNQAIAWMTSHKVGAIVLEGISYYPATALFPDLASGHATPPFKPLGEQAQYQVAGGKPVFAYRLGAALLTQSITPGVAACLEGDLGAGKTAGLARGVVLEVGGNEVAGEGIGFGVPIVHYSDGWVYSRTATNEDVSTATSTIWKRTFVLDEMGGDAAHKYTFVPIATRGTIEVTYTVDVQGILVSVHVVNLDGGFTEVGILNEESAAFDDLAADGAPTAVHAAFGNWVPIQGKWARLQSKQLGVQFWLPAFAGAELHGGRELSIPDFDWAGLDYTFGPSFKDMTYRILVQPSR
jgi:hypothetical protein